MIKRHFASIFVTLILLNSSLGRAADKCVALFDPTSSTNLPWKYYFPMTIRSESGERVLRYCTNSCFAAPTGKSGGTFGSIERDGEAFKPTGEILDFIYSTYNERDTLPPEMISKFKRLDADLEPEHSVFVVSPEKQTGKPRVAIRIFDGSPRTRFLNVAPARLPLEREYPHLVLPDRASGNDYLIELGRLGKRKDVVGDPRILLKSVADYVRRNHFTGAFAKSRPPHLEPVIYVESSAIGARLYKRFGFEVVLGPEQVGAADTYVSRVKASEFVRRFAAGARE